MKLAALLLAVWSIGSCQKDEPSTTRPTMPQSVYLETETGSEVKVAVEVVQTPEARRRGLMHRTSLGPDAGMLFIFEYEELQSFWMRNTLIPLDMLFIDKELKVAGIVHNATPQTDTQRRVDRTSTYVLEVNGGYCKQHRVPVGARVRFEGVELR